MTKAKQAKKAGAELRAAASLFGAAPHDSEEIFRAIFEQAAVGIAVRGVDGRWLQVNQKLCDILGYRREDLLAMTSVEITPPEERDEALDYNRRMMRGEISDYSREKRYLRKDGSTVQVNITVKVVKGSDGRPAYMVSVIEDISARKAAEERLRSGFEHLGEMIALTDENDRIVVANRRFREFNARVAEYVEPGRRYDEHLRAGIALGLFPGAAGREKQWIAERMALLHHPTGPVERERQDGRWLLVDDQRLPDGGGVSFGIEITERKRAEQALRESEERYRRTFELAASGIAHIGLDRCFIRVNQRLCEILGYSEAELLRLTGREISHPEDLDVINRQRPRLYAGEIDSVRVEKRYLRKDGSVVWVSFAMVVERDAAGKPLYEIAVFDDITSRKTADAALRESEERFRQTFELAASGIAQVVDGRFVRVNRSLCEILGYRESALIGRSVKDLSHPADRDVTDAQRARIVAGEIESARWEKRYLRADGSVVWVDLAIALARDAAGVPRYYIGIFDDITERKLAETLLNEAHQELKRSNAELEQFAYVASHDLQEPLRMVSSYTQLLQRRYAGKLDQSAHEFMDYVVEGAARMKQLIEDLLAYSRVGTSGKEFRRVEVENPLRTAIADLRSAIEQAGAAVTWDSLPTVEADEMQLAQLFQNLIGNALKFRAASVPRIHVSCAEKESAWEFAVQDNGIGIEAQYFERVFMVFQRLHNKAEYPGTGIGLAICRKVVERHGGRIWVRSQPGEGSSFYFSLRKKPHG